MKERTYKVDTAKGPLYFFSKNLELARKHLDEVLLPDLDVKRLCGIIFPDTVRFFRWSERPY